jgi:hypothetical protein
MPAPVLFVGGTGPVGQASVPPLLGSREELLAADEPAQRRRPAVLIDTFAGGATATKAQELSALPERSGAGLDWAREPDPLAWGHPWNVRHPFVADTSRPRDVLGRHARQADWLGASKRELCAPALVDNVALAVAARRVGATSPR